DLFGEIESLLGNAKQGKAREGKARQQKAYNFFIFGCGELISLRQVKASQGKERHGCSLDLVGKIECHSSNAGQGKASKA
ncbi:hypothetical protein ACQP3D_30550, partial [Escherichia coli]